MDGLRWPGEAEHHRAKRRIKGLMRAEALAGDEFWMAIGNRSRMIEAFAPTTVWRRTVMAGLPADGWTGAYLATLAGCLRAAPLCRSVEGFRERQCACGHTRRAVSFGPTAYRRGEGSINANPWIGLSGSPVEQLLDAKTS